MQRDDAVYLLDILIAANRATFYLENITWDEFERSLLHQDATMRELEILGEAARRISKTTRQAHPELP